MVIVKTAREISKMKDACRISAEALRVAGEAVKPGAGIGCNFLFAHIGKAH